MKITIFPINLITLLFLIYIAFNYIFKISGVVISSWSSYLFLVATICFFLFIWLTHLIITNIFSSYLKSFSRLTNIIISIILFFLLFFEYKIFSATGLHINLQLWEFISQEDALSQAGISISTLLLESVPILLVLTVLAISEFNFERINKIYINANIIVLTTLTTLSILYGIYSYLMFNGKQEAWTMKRILPYFIPIQRYHINKYVGLIFPGQLKLVSSSRMDRNAIKQPNQTSSLLNIDLVTNNYNIIMVVAESFRSTDIQSNKTITPNLLKYSRTGSFNLDANSASNCTHYSVFSILSGINPSHFNNYRDSLKPPFLIEYLNRSGYKIITSESVSLDWYDLADFVFGPRAQRNIFGVKDIKSDYPMIDKEVTNHAISLAKKYKNSKDNYFNFVYYNSSHYDYKFIKETAKFEPYISGDLQLSEIRNKKEELKNRYLNSLNFIDQEFGRLMTGLENLKALDNTIVIFTGDHGEELFEEGLLGHNTKLNKYQIKVPLLIHHPYNSQTKAGTYELTSHFDIIPTILNLTNNKEVKKNSEDISVITNCGPGYPDGFKVYAGEDIYEFDYDDGYLSIVNGIEGKNVSVLKKLIKDIQ